ncbi:uncharacterized protein LOC134246626, partial [Saccostrea cucullata]|uniref:uncharacterized protein LOC134246626 n=1 Tax=Saccostrea cuccullata TaxID=36930 RepID=UPI002ED4B43C
VAAKVVSVAGRDIDTTPIRRPRSEDTTPVTNNTTNTNVIAPDAQRSTTPATPSLTSPTITPGRNTSAAPSPPVFAGHPCTPQDTTDNTGFFRTITTQLKGLQTTVNTISQDLRLANTKLDAANRRILRLETIAKGLSVARPEQPAAPEIASEETENLQSRIPEDLRIADNILASLHQEANNPGHFACLLLKKLFEELFATGSKVNFNWYGGGSKGKRDLDIRKKKVIQTYVEHYHPEVKDPAVWRDRVVARINECLRRPKKPSKVNNLATDDCVPTQEDAVQRPQQSGVDVQEDQPRQLVLEPLAEIQDEQQRPHGPLTALLYADI